MLGTTNHGAHVLRSNLTRAPAGWNMEDLEEDVKFIADETLDFGGLSPSDSREEEDIAVSVTPEKPLRRGLSNRSNPNAVAPAPQGLRLSLGPLSPEKLEEILHEANRLAVQLEQCALQEQESTGEGLGPRRVKPSPRRETFVLKDSPVRDLLPTVSSLTRSTPSPNGLTPRLRSGDKKGSVRVLRAASGKRPSSVKRESPTCNLLPTSKSPASSPLARSTPPVRGKAGPSGRATASEETWAAKLWACQPNATHQPECTTQQRCPASSFSATSERTSTTKCCRAQSSCFPAAKSSHHCCQSQQPAAPQESGGPRTHQVKRSGQQAKIQEQTTTVTAWTHLYSTSQALSWKAGPDSRRFWPRSRRKRSHQGWCSRSEEMGDGVD
ncbi:proline/serine-rich coiled-coil protein 1 isoform X4 [Herpailurus yagouaroundi]|uniref:proline/serine-rich coiled-coil protein 1 isoform X4 n=1 Tax=Herpailurus yagouaroundi TaxID=1608482 RepID=UPI001AD7D0CE|nr:proline/serine-rich coiled-coil protein 1 isoform X4 [Puma yagouaroundi]